VLTGIGLQGPDREAFLEESESGRTIRVAVGDAVDRGRVTAVTLDGIEILRGGLTRRIAIGEDISLGGVGGPSAGPATGLASTRPGTASQPSAASGDEEEDAATKAILERLRQRRLKELKQ